jgi:hypothetical protein
VCEFVDNLVLKEVMWALMNPQAHGQPKDVCGAACCWFNLEVLGNRIGPRDYVWWTICMQCPLAYISGPLRHSVQAEAFSKAMLSPLL